MPRKYAKKRQPRKTRNYRRKGYKRRSLVSNYVPSGMPTQRIAKLKYAQTMSVTSNTGIIGEQRFSANNIYDPDVTGTGHQPMGHDQWTALFNHYVVLGSKITVNFCDSDASTTPTHVGLYLSDGKTLSYASGYEFIEARKGTYRLIVPNEGKRHRMVNKFSAKRFYSVRDVEDNLSRLGAVSGASPTEQAFYHIWCQTLDATTNTIRCVVEVEYIVLFSEPKDLSVS